MADAQANINVNLDASQALAQLKLLQRQISLFNTEVARGGAQAAASASQMQQNLLNSINATGQFSASLTKVRSGAESFTNALEKNKLSMGQYFRYASAASGKFSQKFSKEFSTINDVARERVKDLQTQYIKLGRDANGAMQAIKVRPLMLDMQNLGTQTAIAAQKQQIFNQLLKQGSTNLINWGKNTQWAGRQLMVGFTIPLTIFGATAAQEFMKLEEQAIRFRRVYGELFTTESETNKALEDIKALAMEFTRYGVAVEKTMSLAADTAAMGKTGAELTAQVAEATRLAVLGSVEQTEALQTTISLTDAFGISAEELTKKIDFLNAVENQTVTSIEDLTIAIPKAGPVVKQLGGDVEDLAFFLTAMKEGGINASEGANALKSGLASLINPTEKASEMLRGFGINISEIVSANEGNVSGIVLDFARALDQLDPLQRAQAIEQLFGKFQFARLSTLFENVIEDGTQAQRVLELAGASVSDLAQLSQSELAKLEESPLFQFRSALVEFQAALAPVGEAFLKLATPFIEFGTKVLNLFNNLSDNAKGFVIGLIGIVGAIGPVFLMVLGLIGNGIGNILLGFANLSKTMQRFRGESGGVAQQIDYMSQEQLQAAAVASSLNQSHATLAQTFTSEIGAINNLIGAYQRMAATQRSALGIPMTTVGATKPAQFSMGRKVPGYANGVVEVPGPKGKGDIVPAMLAPGEAVIPADMAKRYAPLINAMISGGIPGYQKGREISFKGSTYNVSGSEKQVAEILSYATRVAEGLESGSDIVSEALKRIANDTRVTAKSFLRELETVSSELYGNAPSAVRQTVGKEIRYTAKEAGKTGTVEQNLVAARGDVGQEEYNRTLVAQQGAIEALREHYRKAGKSESEIEDLIARRGQVVRAHIAEIDNISKMYQEGWDENLWVAQTEAENQLSNTLVNSQPTMEEYTRHLKDLSLDTEIQDEIIRKVNRNLALTEDELEIQARVLQNMLSDSQTMQNVSSQFEWQAVGAVGAQGARQALGPASQGVGARTPEEISASTTILKQAKSRNVSGEMMSIAQAEARELDTVARNGTRLMVETVSNAMQQGLQQGLQSASPSQTMRREMGNAVDGAVLGVREGQDDMRAAGVGLADAAESGVRSGSGSVGGRRVSTDVITPGKQIKYLRGGPAEEVAKMSKNFGRSLRDATIKVAAMGAKIGMVGIGISSLVGGLAMVEGPLGEFASKLFPLASIMTGLSFAMQMLTKETITEAGNFVAKRRQAIQSAVAEQKERAATEISTVSTQKHTRIQDINAAATKRASLAAEKAANSYMRASAVMGGATGFAGANVAGRAAGQAASKTTLGLAAVGTAIATTLSRISASLGAVFSKLGVVVGAVARGIGGVLGAILGVSAPVALVIAGLALLAGGIYLLVKVMNDQKQKIAGLGDAANISAEKLNNLSDALGIEGSGARSAVIEAAAEPELAGETVETQQEIIDVKNQFLELIDTNKDFKNEWKGTIAALKDGSQEAAQASMEMLAVSLQTEGYAEEQIRGIISALLQLAGRTDITLDFGSISIATQTGAIDAAAQEFINSMTMVRGTYSGSEENLAFDPAALDLFANTLSSAIINVNAQFDQGLITLAEYEAELEAIRQKIRELGLQEGGGEAAAEVARATIESLDPEGLLGLQEQTAGLLEGQTVTGATAAVTVAQAEVAGVDVLPEQMEILEAGPGNTLDQQLAYSALISEIEEAIEAQQELNQETQELADIPGQIEVKTGEIDAQTEAMLDQAQAYDDAKSVLEGYPEVINQEAMARKIANDETLRGLFLDAQKADLAAGNTEQTDALIASLNAQAEATSLLNAQEAQQQVEDAIAEAQAKENALAGLTEATGDAALAQGILNNSMAYGLIAAKLMEQGVEIASASASQIAAAIEASGVLNLINALVEVGGIDIPDLSGGGTGGGGAKEDPTSFLDEIIKKSRDFGNAGQEITKGWEDSLAAISAMADGTAWSMNGLSNQLRRVRVPETLIEKFLGMEPEEWEKAKKTLFVVDETGNITDTTDVGKKVIEAQSQATIAEEIANVESQIATTEDQINAFDRLVASGADVALAYDMIQNKALATAIATAKTTEQVKRLIEVNRELKALEEELEEINEEEQRKKRISDAIEDMNKKFNEQVKALNKIRAAADKYTDAQIEAIFQNQDLMSLFLEPNINPKALDQALKNAEQQAKLELDIKKLTLAGREDILGNAFSQVQDIFAAETERIELNFKLETAGQEEIAEQAQNEIDQLSYMMDDYEAGLTEIQFQEDIINQAYEKRFEALDRIADVNEKIAAQQQQQLDLAEALSRGDIAAAARAAQEMRSQQQADAIDDQRKLIEASQKAEIEGIRSSAGLTRQQLEDEIRLLEQKVFRIEEDRLEPAQEFLRISELRKNAEIESLTVLGRTQDEWDALQNRIDVAKTRNYKFMDQLKDNFSMFDRVMAEYLKERPLAAPPPLPPPPPQPRVANRAKLTSAQIRENNRAWQSHVAQVNAGTQKPDTFRFPNRVTADKTRVKTNQGKGYAMGGLVKGFRMGGLIPYKAEGGLFSALGSDTVPAMLTPGEFVIRRPAVAQFGKDKLEQINRGTYQEGSVYNYNLSVNVKSDANPEQIASTVMREIKRVEGQRIRNNRI